MVHGLWFEHHLLDERRPTKIKHGNKSSQIWQTNEIIQLEVKQHNVDKRNIEKLKIELIKA